jgi:glycerol kinase
MGSAYMAGLYTGFWNKEDIANNWQVDEIFRPAFEEQKINRLYSGWQSAVKRSMNWIEH